MSKRLNWTKASKATVVWKSCPLPYWQDGWANEINTTFGDLKADRKIEVSPPEIMMAGSHEFFEDKTILCRSLYFEINDADGRPERVVSIVYGFSQLDTKGNEFITAAMQEIVSTAGLLNQPTDIISKFERIISTQFDIAGPIGLMINRDETNHEFFFRGRPRRERPRKSSKK